MNKGSHAKRPRGRGNQKRSQGNKNQVFDSNGQDVRVRGTAHQVLEKYLNLARDAAATGDQVTAEGYYQYAEHYYRVINAETEAAAARQARFSPPQEKSAPPAKAVDEVATAPDVSSSRPKPGKAKEEAKISASPTDGPQS